MVKNDIMYIIATPNSRKPIFEKGHKQGWPRFSGLRITLAIKEQAEKQNPYLLWHMKLSWQLFFGNNLLLCIITPGEK